MERSIYFSFILIPPGFLQVKMSAEKKVIWFPPQFRPSCSRLVSSMWRSWANIAGIKELHKPAGANKNKFAMVVCPHREMYVLLRY